MLRAKGDILTRAAGFAVQAGLDSQATGRLIHRIGELRVNTTRSDEVLKGTRLTEQRIDYIKDGKRRYVEIDEVIIKGKKHYIRDYKPINIREFERTEKGKIWAQWMEEHVGKDFRERLRSGENPFSFRVPGIREANKDLVDFLKLKTSKYKSQLEKYTDLYSQAYGVDKTLVKANIQAYFVYR
ncbi:MAG: hypothetical protein QXP01_05000 [Candidatus Hadarchaeum sp.]